jgi:CRISPR-associated exonuclease Cas4
MPYSDADLLPLSALHHLAYCERSCALIHLDRVWVENLFTAEGRARHERAHEAGSESRGPLRIARGIPLRSPELGVSGVADVVEFHRSVPDTVDVSETGLPSETEPVALPGITGMWKPYPVEYKRGRPKLHRADEIQVCAQAMCLEEMLGGYIAEGALFYGKTQRRKVVKFDTPLRDLVRGTAEQLHSLIESGEVPPPVFEKRKCGGCSLLEVCLPEGLAKRRTVSRYIERHLFTSE